MTSVNAQLERLANHWPSFSARLRRLHDGRSKPSAMSRWCQRTCRRLAEPRTFPLLIPWTAGASATNSGTFTFMRKELRDALGDSPLVKFARYATVHFDSEAAVDFILSVAQQQKWLTLIGQQTLIRSSAAFVAAVGRPRRPGNRVCGSGCSSLPEPKAGSDVREAVLWERSRSAGVLCARVSSSLAR